MYYFLLYHLRLHKTAYTNIKMCYDEYTYKSDKHVNSILVDWSSPAVI